MKTAYIGVDEGKGIEEFRKWLESQGYVVYDGEPDLYEDYSIVVINLPFDIPYNEESLFESFKGKQAYTLLKAIKNYRESLPVCDPEDYEKIVKSHELCGDVPLQDRRKLAVKALLHLLSFFARVHSRMAELFAMLDFEHRIYKVVDRVFMGETVEEILVDSLSPICNVVSVRGFPIYLSIFNEIPPGSFITMRGNIPEDAGFDLSKVSEGEILIYKGKIEKKPRFDIVIAEDGPKGIVKSKPMSEDTFMIGSSGIFLKWERTFENMEDLERLAHAFISFSPVPTAAVFTKDEGLVHIRRDFKPSEDLLELPSGDLLAVNFELLKKPSGEYRTIVAPSISKAVRDCLKSSKLVLRRF